MEDPLPGVPLDALLDALQDDRTEFELASVTADMSYREKAKAFAVAGFPEDDLSKLSPGDPPDVNLSKGKPSDQVDFETFKTYIKPYFRPFGEDDLAFLNERGDNVTPYLIPKLGKHYSLQWAEEDGAPVSYASPPPETISSVLNNPNTQVGKSVDRAQKGKAVERNDGQFEREDFTRGQLLSRLHQAFTHKYGAETGAAYDTTEASLGVMSTSYATTDHHTAENNHNIPMLERDFSPLEERLYRAMAHTGIIDPSPETDLGDDEGTENSARIGDLQEQVMEQSR
jgi:transcriptional adapter 3